MNFVEVDFLVNSETVPIAIGSGPAEAKPCYLRQPWCFFPFFSRLITGLLPPLHYGSLPGWLALQQKSPLANCVGWSFFQFIR